MSRRIKNRSYSGRRWPTLVLEPLESRVLPTTMTLMPSADPLVFGQALTFTATVTDVPLVETGTPMGVVDFTLDTSAFNNVSLSSVGATSAQATFSASALSVGAHSITANYAMSGSFGPSSANFTETALPLGTAPGFAGVGLHDEFNQPPPSEPDPIYSGASPFPPDAMGAIGPILTINNQQVQYFVEMINGAFAIYYNNGALYKQSATTANPTTSESLDAFWQEGGASELPTNGDTIDPRIVYDPSSSRWFASSLILGLSDNNILLAVSQSSDPTGRWTFYSFVNTTDPMLSPGRTKADYDTLGVNDNGVYMGVTLFDRESHLNDREAILALPKDPLLSFTPETAEVQSITAPIGSTTATVTTSTPNSFHTGDAVVISGADQNEYNTPLAPAVITVTGPQTFTYTLASKSTVTQATGTITATDETPSVTVAVQSITTPAVNDTTATVTAPTQNLHHR